MTALITGGTGFLGGELVRRLYGKVPLRIVARNEGKLIELKELYPDVEIMPGDIMDRWLVNKAVEGVDCVYHLAAFKHVGMAESDTLQCVQSNLLGSLNLLQATRSHELKFFLAVSTDKAAQVSGVYGATKLLMERLIQEFQRTYPTKKYRLVRYGNVLYSTGSVLCKWRSAIENLETLTITDPEATRFYWSVEQAVDLIKQCLKEAQDASPFCPTMKAIRLRDLLSAMLRKYWPDKAVEPHYNAIGLQPGENMHERVLESGPMSNEVPLYSVEEIMELV